MTTRYAQHVFDAARLDVALYGALSAETENALTDLGYSPRDIARLEKKIHAATCKIGRVTTYPLLSGGNPAARNLGVPIMCQYDHVVAAYDAIAAIDAESISNRAKSAKLRDVATTRDWEDCSVERAGAAYRLTRDFGAGRDFALMMCAGDLDGAPDAPPEAVQAYNA